MKIRIFHRCLIEDCENLISKRLGHRKPYTSGTLKCEDGTYSPNPNVKAYGEWFNENCLAILTDS